MNICCMSCNQRKVNMVAYVPYNSKSRVAMGKPGFMCKDCLESQRKAKRVR